MSEENLRRRVEILEAQMNKVRIDNGDCFYCQKCQEVKVGKNQGIPCTARAEAWLYCERYLCQECHTPGWKCRKCS